MSIFAESKPTDMNNKIVKVVTALVFAAVAVVLVLLMIQEVKAGLATAGRKGFFALYVALLLYALWRVFSIIRSLFSRL